MHQRSHTFPTWEVRMFRTAVGVSIALLCLAGSAPAQSSRTYTEGYVTSVSYVRTKPGKFDEYLKYIEGPYRSYMESLKNNGTIIAYQVFASDPRTAEDWDVVLTTVYKNMAALDGLDERTDSVVTRVFGSEAQQMNQTIDRGALREVLGTRLLRELLPK